MHQTNTNWWIYTAGRWASWFAGGRVIEFGSYNVNGTIRELFGGVSSWTGVDWRSGPCVDIVSLAHEVSFEAGSFDVVCSASMLEHDPFWAESLGVMVRLVRRGGLLLVTWGSHKNVEHELHSAPDGGFHARRSSEVLDLLGRLGMHIQEFRYEKGMPFNRPVIDAAARRLAMAKADGKASGKESRRVVRKWERRRVQDHERRRREYETGLKEGFGSVCLAAVGASDFVRPPVWIDIPEAGD